MFVEEIKVLKLKVNAIEKKIVERTNEQRAQINALTKKINTQIEKVENQKSQFALFLQTNKKTVKRLKQLRKSFNNTTNSDEAEVYEQIINQYFPEGNWLDLVETECSSKDFTVLLEKLGELLAKLVETNPQEIVPGMKLKAYPRFFLESFVVCRELKKKVVVKSFASIERLLDKLSIRTLSVQINNLYKKNAELEFMHNFSSKKFLQLKTLFKERTKELLSEFIESALQTFGYLTAETEIEETRGVLYFESVAYEKIVFATIISEIESLSDEACSSQADFCKSFFKEFGLILGELSQCSQVLFESSCTCDFVFLLKKFLNDKTTKVLGLFSVLKQLSFLRVFVEEEQALFSNAVLQEVFGWTNLQFWHIFANKMETVGFSFKKQSNELEVVPFLQSWVSFVVPFSSYRKDQYLKETIESQLLNTLLPCVDEIAIKSSSAFDDMETKILLLILIYSLLRKMVKKEVEDHKTDSFITDVVENKIKFYTNDFVLLLVKKIQEGGKEAGNKTYWERELKKNSNIVSYLYTDVSFKLKNIKDFEPKLKNSVYKEVFKKVVRSFFGKNEDLQYLYQKIETRFC